MAETITAIAALVAAIGGIVAAILAYRARSKVDAVEVQLGQIGDKVFKLDERVDGRLSDLIRSNREKAEAQIVAAEARGYSAGEQAQRDRAGPPAP